MKKVTIYSTPTCMYCHVAKQFFADNKVEYTEYNVAADLEKRKEMVTKSGGLGVPVIDVEGEVIVGFDQQAITRALGLKA